MPKQTGEIVSEQDRIDAIPDSECGCRECQAMCQHRPCWPTPKEADALMDAGYAARLMLDWWAADGELDDTDILSPAIVGREGEGAPSRPLGVCTFLTDDNLCELHDLGLKPTEGRKVHHATEAKNLHMWIARMWADLDEDEAERLTARWKQEATE